MGQRRPNFSGINRMEHHAGIHVSLDTVSVCIADVLGQPVRDLQSVGQAAREHFDWSEGFSGERQLGPERPQRAAGRLEDARRLSGRVAWTSLGARPSPNRST